jgi:hypothetical protein
VVAVQEEHPAEVPFLPGVVLLSLWPPIEPSLRTFGYAANKCMRLAQPRGPRSPASNSWLLLTFEQKESGAVVGGYLVRCATRSDGTGFSFFYVAN